MEERLIKRDLQNEKKIKNKFLLKGFIYGGLVHIALWILVLIIFTIFVDINTVPYLFKKITETGFLLLLLSLFVITLFFGGMGFLIAEIIFLIKSRNKRYSLTSIFSKSLILLAILTIFIDKSIIKQIVGKRILLLPINIPILSDIIMLVLAYALGTFIGYIYPKLKIARNTNKT